MPTGCGSERLRNVKIQVSWATEDKVRGLGFSRLDSKDL